MISEILPEKHRTRNYDHGPALCQTFPLLPLWVHPGCNTLQQRKKYTTSELKVGKLPWMKRGERAVLIWIPPRFLPKPPLYARITIRFWLAAAVMCGLTLEPFLRLWECFLLTLQSQQRGVSQAHDSWRLYPRCRAEARFLSGGRWWWSPGLCRGRFSGRCCGSINRPRPVTGCHALGRPICSIPVVMSLNV
jgi:hypothetical protein